MRAMARLVRSEVSKASCCDNTGFINYSHKNLFLHEASRPQQTQLNCIYFNSATIVLAKRITELSFEFTNDYVRHPCGPEVCLYRSVSRSKFHLFFALSFNKRRGRELKGDERKADRSLSRNTFLFSISLF